MKNWISAALDPDCSSVPEDCQENMAVLNIDRAVIVSVCVLLLQLAALASGRFFLSPMYIVGGILMGCVCLGYLVVTQLVMRRRRYKKPEFVCFCFWISLCFCFYPYIYGDITTAGWPLNSLLMIGLLVAAPVLTLRQSCFFFSAVAAVNIVAALVGRAASGYLLAVIPVCLFAFVISRVLHGAYFRLINQLYRQTVTDGLTLLLNRRGGWERAEEAVALCRRHSQLCAVMMIDIDFFKAYNDVYGHSKGDEALALIAEAMKRCFARRSDVLFRYGGEEFAVCVSAACGQDAVKLAERLHEAVAALGLPSPFKDEGDGLLTVSIGITIQLPGDPELDFESLIKRADEAVYAAKERGRGCTVCFEPSLRA